MSKKISINKNLLASATAMAVLASLGMASATAAPLSVGRDASTVAAAASAAPARIIVRYKDNTAAAATSAGKSRVLSQAAGRTSSAALKAASFQHRRKLAVGADLFTVGGRPSRAELQTLVSALRADPAVEFAEIDEMMRPAAAPNDQYFAQYQWHLQATPGGINAPAAWETSQGEGVIVAVIDTGILPAHPDFEAGALLEGYDFISDAFISRRPTNERVPGALDYGDWNDDASQCDVGGSSWHGTHVSGTVAEATNNSIGMAGVAPKATILPIRALGRCGGYTSDIADAIVWASGGTVAGMPANPNPAQVINMSLGGGGACSTSGATQLAINGAVSRGTTVVVAAGNSNANAANYSPASCANVINVGANGITGARASYSNYGASVDISAPGGGGGVDGNPNGYVWQALSNSSTGPTNGTLTYGGMAGTSMASPHVAGVVALVQSALVANDQAPLTPAAMEQLLKDTARAFPVSIPTSTPIGAGIVDPAAALAAALGTGGSDPGDPGDTTATPLTNKVAVTGVSGGDKLYSFTAEAGKVLSIMTYGGSGDVSLHVKHGAEPTAAANDGFSTRAGNSETVRITAPVAGTYYIKLSGTYSGVTVVARQ